MTRLDWMAVGWGGMVAGVGIVLVSTGDDLWRFVGMTALCLLAGFLAGVRSETRRVVHAAASAVAGAAFWVVFVALTWAADPLGGPKGADWTIGGDWLARNLVVALVAAIAGGALAAHRLRPQGGQRRSRD